MGLKAGDLATRTLKLRWLVILPVVSNGRQLTPVICCRKLLSEPDMPCRTSYGENFPLQSRTAFGNLEGQEIRVLSVQLVVFCFVLEHLWPEVVQLFYQLRHRCGPMLLRGSSRAELRSRCSAVEAGLFGLGPRCRFRRGRPRGHS